jgi:hypothetical protein
MQSGYVDELRRMADEAEKNEWRPQSPSLLDAATEHRIKVLKRIAAVLQLGSPP